MVVFSAWALLVTATGVLTTIDDEGGPASSGVLACLLIVGYFAGIAVLAYRLRPQPTQLS
jgi:hypothetical protein